jgi:hypothetical protein
VVVNVVAGNCEKAVGLMGLNMVADGGVSGGFVVVAVVEELTNNMERGIKWC